MLAPTMTMFLYRHRNEDIKNRWTGERYPVEKIIYLRQAWQGYMAGKKDIVFDVMGAPHGEWMWEPSMPGLPYTLGLHFNHQCLTNREVDDQGREWQWKPTRLHTLGGGHWRGSDDESRMADLKYLECWSYFPTINAWRKYPHVTNIYHACDTEFLLYQ